MNGMRKWMLAVGLVWIAACGASAFHSVFFVGYNTRSGRIMDRSLFQRFLKQPAPLFIEATPFEVYCDVKELGEGSHGLSWDMAPTGSAPYVFDCRWDMTELSPAIRRHRDDPADLGEIPTSP